ncbi:hypothetical protein C8R46DRAFT_1228473 [Mycena filopes]|nr:hypothetical protein C8R46DRAFT_1228473 [Mycena filopes]
MSDSPARSPRSYCSSPEMPHVPLASTSEPEPEHEHQPAPESEQSASTTVPAISRDLSFCLKAAEAPVHRLPVELLGEIFLACLPPDKYTRANAKLAPLVVSWVCTSWRNIALSLPKLWSSLALEPPHTHANDATHCAYLCQARFWLARAGRRKLSLSLQPRRGLYGDSRAPIQDYTTFLTVEAYLQRCTRLELNVPLPSAQVLQLLAKSFVLTEAKFSEIYVGWCPDHPLVEVENLEVLEFATPSSGLDPLLRWLVLPRLRDLTMSDSSSQPASWLATLSLLERSQCQLQRFSYTTQRHSVVNGAITEFLQHPALADVHSLVVRGFLISQHAVEVLGQQQQHLPLLTALELATCSNRNGELGSVVAARCAPANKNAGPPLGRAWLRSVTVKFDAEAHDRDVTALNALALGGLVVDVQPS